MARQAFGITRAPEIDRPGLTWFNTAGPLSLKDLRGKLVLLDFWTSCCINCVQILPTLRLVEETFPDDVVVIGVHSPKFSAERQPRNVAAAIARYGIRHPVAHDPGFQLWQQYGVRAWPTLTFISPHGYVVGQTSGEPDPQALLDAVAEALRQYHGEGLMRPGALDLPDPVAPAGSLLFPGKVKPLPGPEKGWVVADPGHHQVVLLDDEGQELLRFGSGREGPGDGAAAHGVFSSPQGLVADEDSVYVADTGNHAIRRIDRATGQITTLAGTGKRGPVLGFDPAPGLAAALASPWDLELAGQTLYIANAGTHQLAALDLETGELRAIAGSGAEGLHDGPAAEVPLAQPSGLSLSPDGGTLYFADSETSAIRALDFASGTVRTLVGKGLFDFGNEDGSLDKARLQHPLGVAAWGDGKLLVADSYNAAIRVLDLEAGTLSELEQGRVTCTDPVCLPYGEPAGVLPDGLHRLLVSDTNNHRIMEIRLDTGTSRTWAK